ncbi:probable phosphatase of HAD hydrolase superfamily [Lachnospiraceae bacterium KM106-2]|nr:probable phosphatase of HAD hydrolase superfamily [Lachnospiraceae bacterium KM106-2]
MKKGIIFDLDGTLWDASSQVVPAWNLVLSRHQELQKQITLQDMQSFMGKQLDEITHLMFPNLLPAEGIAILKECCKGEQVYLRIVNAQGIPD